ncbi:MAG: putative deoxyguanosinetriphosphate triphosphohydrolase [Dehalococcoidia bacterium]|nr:putative deoxyguanosinetriphosphate triphosphohydrolase [Dehalococcoidia bacterium]
MLEEVRQRLELRERSLSPFAVKARESRGRVAPEEPSPLRTEFQRDRDRIIHSNAFRRLKHKTQVFIAPAGDHYVTRLTHTLEVAQIGRTIARALNLNEDLVEAIALGHDLGHTPFGHVGEEELNRLHPEGFQHASQSVRVVEHLEKNGQGLNLTWEVREGIGAHSKPREDLMGAPKDNITLEAQVCRISDAVAYLNHDIGDAIRAGLLSEEDLPTECKRVLGTRHSQRIDTMVTDIVESSWSATGAAPPRDGEEVTIAMSTRVRQAANTLRGFMFHRVYLPAGEGEPGQQARAVVGFLYDHFNSHPEEIPQEYHIREEPAPRMAVDYISGMTDHFALRLAERIQPGITAGLASWQP